MTLCVNNVKSSTHNVNDVITADRDLAPEIHAMIRRTIGRIVDGHARSKQDEKLEAILNFAKYNLLPEDSISLFRPRRFV